MSCIAVGLSSALNLCNVLVFLYLYSVVFLSTLLGLEKGSGAILYHMKFPSTVFLIPNLQCWPECVVRAIGRGLISGDGGLICSGPQDHGIDPSRRSYRSPRRPPSLPSTFLFTLFTPLELLSLSGWFWRRLIGRVWAACRKPLAV